MGEVDSFELLGCEVLSALDEGLALEERFVGGRCCIADDDGVLAVVGDVGLDLLDGCGGGCCCGGSDCLRWV